MSSMVLYVWKRIASPVEDESLTGLMKAFRTFFVVVL